MVADCTLIESVQTIETIGQQICDSFYQDRLIARTNSAAAEAQNMSCTPTGGITSWDWCHFNRVNL